MKSDTVTQNNALSITMYQEMLKSIEFMGKYLEDTEIFNPDSTSFKNFLIQSFCFLYPDFHYLSFLRKEEIDLEIVKVAGILQILPANAKKITKLFENMTKDDIHMFWLKFFTLFKKQNDISTSTLFNLSWEEKINFFHNMTSTLNYLNYEFPVVNKKKFNSVDINEEIDNWKTQVVGTDIALDELVTLNSDEAQAIDVDIDKLSIYLKQIRSIYSNKKLVQEENQFEHIEFYLKFINLSKSILQYKKNVQTISFLFSDEFNINIFSSKEHSQENVYFIKRYNNLVNALKSQLKMLY